MGLAVVILGESNSGKTSTIKQLVKRHTYKGDLTKMRAGSQKIIIDKALGSLTVECYCVPGSPSEQNH
ncbi:MAG: hypothetical protein MI784_10730, partial [Cytophagales bacterium]|nr:hypothetical protein [Cytophagales bacterium]